MVFKDDRKCDPVRKDAGNVIQITGVVDKGAFKSLSLKEAAEDWIATVLKY